MCLILLALRAHPEYPLVIAANRDELYVRPTAAAGFWKDSPRVLAGRDLVCGGTWLGVDVGGRFAAVSNFRDGREVPEPRAPSRGMLVADYLKGAEPVTDY
ncbi:MAG: NRDE family protein, partial [Actinomycetota bacterium]